MQPDQNKRTKAMKWWLSMPSADKVTFTKYAYPGRSYRTITGREIEKMYTDIPDKDC